MGLRVLTLFDTLHKSSPETTSNCANSRENQLHMANQNEFKYRQLHRSPIVEVYMMAVPLNVSFYSQSPWLEIMRTDQAKSSLKEVEG